MSDSNDTTFTEETPMADTMVAEPVPTAAEPTAETKKPRRKHHAAKAADEQVGANGDGATHVRILKVGMRKFQIPWVDLIDPLTDEEYKELKADIKDRGIVDAVKLLAAKGEPDIVIDGHNRLTIAGELGILPKDIPFQYITGVTKEEAEEDAVRLNFQRRKNTPERRAHMAHKLAKPPHDFTARRIGRMLGCHHTTVLEYLERPDPLAATVEQQEATMSATATGIDGRSFQRKKVSQITKTQKEEGGEKIDRGQQRRIKGARHLGMKALKSLARCIGPLGFEHKILTKSKAGAVVEELYDLIKAVQV